MMVVPPKTSLDFWLGKIRPDVWPEGWKPEITVLIPDYNEADNIAETVTSALGQSYRPYEVLVGDDCSDDNSGQIAQSAGARVIRLSRQGVKAGVINQLLDKVETPYIIVLDADVKLKQDAIEKLIVALADGKTFCASGFIIPWKRETWTEILRTVQYVIYMSLPKIGQSLWASPIVASGCFLAINMDVLRSLGTFNGKSIAEDMELTWRALVKGFRVKFVPDAVCYALDPPNLTIYKKQVMRWYRGFFQILWATGFKIFKNPGLTFFVGLSLAELAFTTIAWVMLLYAAASMYVAYAMALPVTGLLPQFTAQSFVFLAIQSLYALAIAMHYGVKKDIEKKVLLKGWFYYFTTGWGETIFILEAWFREWVLGQHEGSWAIGHAQGCKKEQ